MFKRTDHDSYLMKTFMYLICYSLLLHRPEAEKHISKHNCQMALELIFHQEFPPAKQPYGEREKRPVTNYLTWP